MTQRTCTLEGCERPYEALGYCKLHYRRLRDWGDPLRTGAGPAPVEAIPKSRYSVWDRFWMKVDKDGPIPSHVPHLGKCWIFTGTLRPDGYGTFSIRRPDDSGWMNAPAHRVSWILRFGEPPPDKPLVLHGCDNPACVRHLWVGTYADNSLDMVLKGRAATGERNTTGNRRRAQTHCKRGHPLSGDNLYVHPTTGFRRCRLCTRDAMRAKRARLMGQSPEAGRQDLPRLFPQ
jgi:hypothetical protein